MIIFIPTLIWHLPWGLLTGVVRLAKLTLKYQWQLCKFLANYIGTRRHYVNCLLMLHNAGDKSTTNGKTSKQYLTISLPNNTSSWPFQITVFFFLWAFPCFMVTSYQAINLSCYCIPSLVNHLWTSGRVRSKLGPVSLKYTPSYAN